MQRQLIFQDSKSDKFWHVQTDGTQVTVCYGRRGTAGTTKTKEYASEEAAVAEAEKLVAQKMKKGYVDDPHPTPHRLTPVAPTPPSTGKKTTKKSAKKTADEPAPPGDEPAAQAPAAEPEPAPAPLEVSDAAAEDLGLLLSPFEQLYDINAEVALDMDDDPFDPQAEAERAARILEVVTYSDGYSKQERWQFREPLFTKFPSQERRDWWRAYFKEHELKTRSWRTSDSGIPTWAHELLRIKWEKDVWKILASEQRKLPTYLWMRAVLPSLPAEQVESARAHLPSEAPSLHETNRWGGVSVVGRKLFEAWALGAVDPDTVRARLAEVENSYFTDDWDNGALIALLAPTPSERVAWARRTRARIVEWDGVVPWLVGTGQEGFGLLLHWIEGQSRDIAQALLAKAADTAHGPGAASLFLDAMSTKAGPVAEQWIRTHLPQCLAAHLTPSQADALVPFLRKLPVDQLRSLQDSTAGPTRAALERVLSEATLPFLPAETEWWQQAATELPAPPKKTQFTPTGLPPLLVDGSQRLTEAQTADLLLALRSATEHPLVTAVREHTSRANRDEFALALFRAWIGAGAPAKESWAMENAGWLGDSAFVQHLTPLIRQWPGESQHQRAVKGLTALRNVATDEALQQISGIAAKVKFAGLKRRAGEAMDEIAAQRGLTRDELEDRVLADGGLDARGQRTFDYGARQFLAYVTSAGKLAARLLDADGRPTGKVLTNLPAANKSDDAEAAKAAKAEFTAVKKTVATLAKVQLERFERAMITGRSWNATDFTTLIAPHPVLRGLLAGIVWALWSPDGALAATARIEDGELLDATDEPVDATGLTITVAHPLDLSPADRAAWAQSLADYELTTPFKQLDRPVLTLSPAQGDQTLLVDIPKQKIAPGKLFGTFTKNGWQRGAVLDAGGYTVFGLPVPAAGITAIATFDPGLWIGNPLEMEDQQLDEVYLVEGAIDPAELDYGWRHDRVDFKLVPWSQAPAKIVSEVLSTLEQMIA
ncbi:DUF4132 domain-containing protein [Buchananella hordeovulneris]|uniref:DUF4132 domain-containing protein n=1 Tax=Buchananella hordeovulneris TaxID=52770 RepID=UPI0026DAA395|nr:DUF4132 domain-containing protein [Buchananella hordeovulneris]MDO5080910.1 DUF4132 domain-containing protein [Buchananella hordeovulneris]